MTDDWRLTTAAFTLAASAACAHHYTTTGLVLHVQKPGASVTISHDAFPGFMDAMAMPFDLKDGAQRVRLTAGDRVKFRLSAKDGRSPAGAPSRHRAPQSFVIAQSVMITPWNP